MRKKDKVVFFENLSKTRPVVSGMPIAVTVGEVQLSADEVAAQQTRLSAEAKQRLERAHTYPFAVLSESIETIVDELELILDEDLDLADDMMLDGKNMEICNQSIEDAEAALKRMVGLNCNGAIAAQDAFRWFVETYKKPSFDELPEIAFEVDPDDYLSRVVVRQIKGFRKKAEAEIDAMCADESRG